MVCFFCMITTPFPNKIFLKKGEQVEYKIRENERNTRDASRSKPENKKKFSLKKLQRTQRFRGEGLESVVYDPKSLKKFGGIVE